VIGVLGGLIAALAWGSSTVVASRSTRMIGSQQALAYVLICGTVLTVPLALVVDGIPSEAGARAWAWAVLGGFEWRRIYVGQAAAPLRVADDTPATSRGASWAYWVLPLLALGGLLWFLFPREERTVEAVPTTQPTSLPAPTRPATDAPAKVTFLTTAREDWTSIGASPNEYTNQDVYNGAGENLGTIRDLLIGPDGKAAAAVINVGRFLGIGDKEIAVPFSALRVERHGDSRRIVIDAMKEGVQAAPAFSRRAGAKQ